MKFESERKNTDLIFEKKFFVTLMIKLLKTINQLFWQLK